MNLLFDIGHPAHIHLFKNFIKWLISQNHNVIVTTRKKEITEVLLEHYEIPFISLSSPKTTKIGMMWELFHRDKEIFKLHLKHKFDFSFGTSVSITHLTLLKGVKSFVFNEDDDDVVPLFTKITYPFSTQIINPIGLRYSKWRNKRIQLNTYHELAYLHPHNFKPNKTILNSYNLVDYEYIILRKSALKAHHDTHAKGINHDLEKYLRGKFPSKKVITTDELKESNIKPWDMHHVLAFAYLLFSDSQTMSMEAAVLGVPSIRYNTFANNCSVLNELEQKYKLTHSYFPGKDDEKCYQKIDEFASKTNELLALYQKRKEELLKDKIDFNEWMITWFQNELTNG